jgi:hypothetical protein
MRGLIGHVLLLLGVSCCWAQLSTTGSTFQVAGGGSGGAGSAPGYVNGNGTLARFQSPSAIAICPQNASVAFVADSDVREPCQLMMLMEVRARVSHSLASLFSFD